MFSENAPNRIPTVFRTAPNGSYGLLLSEKIS
jgi:hypothetical protein